MRLLSHLQCFSAQREAAAKASLQHSSWSPLPTHTGINSQYPTSAMTPMGSMITSQLPNQPDLPMGPHSSAQALSSLSYSDTRVSQPDISSTSLHGNMRIQSSNMTPHSQMSNMNTTAQEPLISSIPQLSSQFQVSLNSMPMMSQNGNNFNSAKPYRPWGAELAY
jgi:YRPW motif-containing protein